MSAVAAAPAPRVPGAAQRLIADVRRRWLRALWARGLARALALALAAAALLVAVDLVSPLTASARTILRWLPPLLLAGQLLRAAWRARRPTLARLALLAQEQVPGLENRLATAMEIGAAPPGPIREAFLAELDRSLARLGPPALRPQLRVPLLVAAGLLTTALSTALLFPALARESAERWLHPRDAYPQAWRETRAAAAGRTASVPPPALGELRWTLRPPAYAGLPVVRGRGEEPLVALPGSRLELRSHLSRRWDGVRVARPGAAALPTVRRDGEWVVSTVIAAEERGLTVEAIAGGEVVSRRALAITVTPDAPPDVRLTEPRNDLVLATASGRITLAASAADDLGVAAMHLAWSRTRGSGETFEYVDGEWPLAGVRPGRQVVGTRVIDLAALELQPGDVLHVRAVARDRNDVGGPGEGVSSTRTIRIARPDELDRVNTDIGFPIELPENPLLSQRMIVIRTERLRDRARALGPAEVRRQAAELAREQGRLREVVGEQVFTRATGGVQDPFADLSFTETGGAAHAHEGEAPAPPARTPEEVAEEASEATGQGTLDEVAHRHDASPILDVNRTMQRLYDLMWASERELNQAAPAAALPHQYEALRLIQELRRTERRFPRGSLTVDAVDVDAARGTGKLEDAAPTPRRPAPPLPDATAALAELERAAAVLATQGPRAGSLTLSALAARLLATPGVDAVTISLVSQAGDLAGKGRHSEAVDRLGRARLRLAPAAGARRAPLPAAVDPASAEYFRRIGRP